MHSCTLRNQKNALIKNHLEKCYCIETWKNNCIWKTTNIFFHFDKTFFDACISFFFIFVIKFFVIMLILFLLHVFLGWKMEVYVYTLILPIYHIRDMQETQKKWFCLNFTTFLTFLWFISNLQFKIKPYSRK